MKNWRNFGVLACLAVLAACAPAGPPGRTDVPQVQVVGPQVQVQHVGPQVQAPVYKHGDWWVFRHKVGNAPPKESRITYKNGNFESDDPDLLESPVRITVHPNNPERKWFNFPLVKGKKWSFQYSATSPVTGYSSSRDAEAEIVGPLPLPVKTPAGEFKVIEIRRTDTRPRVEMKMIYFYSPKTKSVVKVTADADTPMGLRHIELELLKYSVR